MAESVIRLTGQVGQAKVHLNNIPDCTVSRGALFKLNSTFFPVPWLFAAKPQKAIVRVNGRERGWKFDIVAKCPHLRARARAHPPSMQHRIELTSFAKLFANDNIWLSYLHAACLPISR